MGAGRHLGAGGPGPAARAGAVGPADRRTRRPDSTARPGSTARHRRGTAPAEHRMPVAMGPRLRRPGRPAPPAGLRRRDPAAARDPGQHPGATLHPRRHRDRHQLVPGHHQHRRTDPPRRDHHRPGPHLVTGADRRLAHATPPPAARSSATTARSCSAPWPPAPGSTAPTT